MNVSDFGAIGNATTDDTAAIQACLDAAATSGREVEFPPGNFRITSTLSFGKSGQQSHFRAQGAGPLATKLRWEGPTTGPGAVLARVEGLFMGGIHGLGFTHPAGADGTGQHYGQTVGLWLANTTGSGSGQNGNRYSDLFFEGFASGLLAGDVANTRSASELLFQNVRVQYCDVGVRGSDSNTLDLDFYMLQTARCRVGLDPGQCGNLHVYGGSSSYNEIDFSFGTAGTYSINGYRSEVASKHCVFVYGVNVLAPTRVAVRNCNFQAIKTGGGDYGVGTGGTGGGCGVWLFGGAEVTIDQSHIEGWVGVADYYSRPKLTMSNTTVRPLPGQTGPFAFFYGTAENQYGDRYLDNLRYDVRGCSRMAADSPFWPAGADNRPDPSAFFTDASGFCPATGTRTPPAPWNV